MKPLNISPKEAIPVSTYHPGQGPETPHEAHTDGFADAMDAGRHKHSTEAV